MVNMDLAIMIGFAFGWAMGWGWSVWCYHYSKPEKEEIVDNGK